MQPDQLTQLLQIIREAGAGTKDVAIIYLLITLLKPLLGWTALGIIVSKVSTLIRQCFFHNHRCTQAWIELARGLGVTCADDHPTRGEIQRALKTIDVMVKEIETLRAAQPDQLQQ
jgi:hypothetical protein